MFSIDGTSGRHEMCMQVNMQRDGKGDRCGKWEEDIRFSYQKD